MLEGLSVSETTEEVVTTKVVTATFTFTDEDLEQEDVRRFYDMIAPQKVEADPIEEDGMGTDEV